MGVSFSFLLPYSSAWTEGGALIAEIGSTREVGIGCRNMKYQKTLYFWLLEEERKFLMHSGFIKISHCFLLSFLHSLVLQKTEEQRIFLIL